jgi:hypothetical protein
MMEAHDAVKYGLIGEYTAVLFQNRSWPFALTSATLYDMDSQSILFFYIHFLSAVYLPLLALFVAQQVTSYGHWLSDVVGLVVVMLQAIFVIGIRVLAQVMHNPLGENWGIYPY